MITAAVALTIKAVPTSFPRPARRSRERGECAGNAPTREPVAGWSAGIHRFAAVRSCGDAGSGATAGVSRAQSSGSHRVTVRRGCGVSSSDPTC